MPEIATRFSNILILLSPVNPSTSVVVVVVINMCVCLSTTSYNLHKSCLNHFIE